MALVTEYFSAFTPEKVEATDVYLPLSDSAKADLLALLDDESKYIFLSLKDEVNLETVKVKASGGLLIMERGLEGTEAVLHPLDTCVSSVSPTLIATMKDLICNYECCEGGCPVVAVRYSTATLPAANVGKSWSGTVEFTGSTPMTLNAANPPSWMNVTQSKTTLLLSGTPTTAGSVSVGVFGINGDGTNVATKELVINVAS